ncbi:hypothetical protein KDD17_17460 [Sulfitobacter albidus]|uniref:Uncharacterized protein n=1 Tax=Sulfitobacter albidus TaxID=2829501 RepID=A0A975JGK2_9RHOB|nr:hypothetical protein [Sulfitobacter albidus]QUJ78129.1 hypothetical protein KDD17_17460 [Sulfitobacter albidus]
MEAVWVELLSNRAYRADVTLDAGDLPRTASLGETVELKVIFGPHGLLVIGGERTEANPQPIDLEMICGARSPANDRDYSKNPREFAGLFEAYSDTYPPVSPQTHCPEPRA